jgi:PEP-CTERM motif
VRRKTILLLAALCCLPSAARADLTIIVGTHFIMPNTANQAIQIVVTGGTNVEGMDFVAQVGDGGPTNIFTGPGNIAGPRITADLLTGTIWATNHNPITHPAGGAEGDQTVYLGITTASGTVTANGLIGTIFVDTTGILFGPPLNGMPGHHGWELNMGGGQGVWDNPNNPLNIATVGGQNMLPTNTDFPPLTVGNGLNIVDGLLDMEAPEPDSLALIAIGLAGLMIARIRKRD